MSEHEQQIREAISERTGSVDPGDGWEAIQAKVAARERARRLRLWAGASVAAALLAAVAVGATVFDDDGDNLRTQGTTGGSTTSEVASTPETATVPTSGSSTTSTSSSTTASTTTTTTTTSSTTATPPPDLVAWVFPAELPTAPNDPRALALGFANKVLGFADPQVGDFQQGDSRSGEVPVRPRPTSTAVTTVLVRAVDAEATTWVVTAAVTDAIRVEAPEPGSAVSWPLTVSGSAQVFEGHVAIEVLSMEGTLLAETYATAAGDRLQPFSTTVEPLPAGQGIGGPAVLLLYEGDASGEGVASVATVIPINLT